MYVLDCYFYIFACRSTISHIQTYISMSLMYAEYKKLVHLKTLFVINDRFKKKLDLNVYLKRILV